jgi:hypothetical protein
MNTLKLWKSAAVTAVLSIALVHGPAIAAVDFDTHANPMIMATGVPVLSGGFSFSSPGAIGVVSGDSFPTYGVNNHTPMLVFANNGQVTITQVGGGLFSLGSLDVGGWFNLPAVNNAQLNIVGHSLSGNQTAYSSLSTTSFAHVTLSPLFTGLSSLTLSITGVPNSPVYAAIDNLVLTPVPEPETYALLLAGLGLLAVVGRRRKTLG